MIKFKKSMHQLYKSAAGQHSLLVNLTICAIWLACGAFWYFRLTSPTVPSANVAIPADRQPVTNHAALASLLGVISPTTISQPIHSVERRFILSGVLADMSGFGAAVISVDGKPAKPFRVGGEVSAGYSLKSVKARSAVLQAPDANSITLEMAPLKK